MDYRQIDPDLPSFSRLMKLGRAYPNQSILRMMEYEQLAKIKLDGKVLDLGGGAKAKYRSKLPTDIDYNSVNIDPSIEPTWLVQPGEPLPIDDDNFDYCISMNTLEHVFDPRFLLGEIFRVLKPGAKVYITVPWIFRIHAHPDDYTRATPSWWREALAETGFSTTEILPLVWGRHSSGYAISEHRGLFGKGFERQKAQVKDILSSKVYFMGKDTYEGKRGQRICNIALGHFITAQK